MTIVEAKDSLNDRNQFCRHKQRAYTPTKLIALKFVDAGEAAACETALWGIGHTEAGAFLADTWGFPESLRRCITDHHGQVSASDDPLLHVVQLACGLATSLGYPEAVAVTGLSESPTPLLPPDLIRRPDFAPERLHKLIANQLAPRT